MKINFCTNESNAPKGTALIVKPERKPKAEDIAICAEHFEDVICGSLEGTVYPKMGIAIFFDKDWDILRLPVNRVILDKNNPEQSTIIYGTFIVVGIELDDDNNVSFTGLTKEQLHYYKAYFDTPVRMQMVNGKPEPVFVINLRKGRY